MFNSINDKSKHIFSKLSYIMAIVFLGIIVSIMGFASIYISEREVVTPILFNFYWLVFFAINIGVLILLIINFEKINEKIFFCVFACIYLIFGILLILNISPKIRADAGAVLRAAQQMRNGVYTFFTHRNYLNFYPHQHGLVYYDYILTSIYDSSKILFLANLFEIICINFFIYKIVDLLGQSNKLKNILTIFLVFAFTPQFFFLAFAYNLVPGFFFMIIGLYLFLKYIKEEKNIHLVLSILFFVIATIIRSNFIIAVIAAFLYAWINSKKLNKAIIFIVSFFVVSKIFTFGMNSLTEKITNVEVSSGMPKILWIAMGTDPDNMGFGPGWYNGYGRIVLEKVEYDYEKASKIGKEKIMENFKKHLSKPLKAVEFFGAKHISTWADPTYESIWSGPLTRFKQGSNSNTIKSIYYEGDLFWGNFHYMKSIQVIIYAFAFYYLINKKKRNTDLIFFVIFFVGGAVFHLFWETKSQYVYPYVMLMIPLAVEGIINFKEKYLNKKL